MGRDDVADLDVGERHWDLVRFGDLHGAAEHDGDQSIGVAVDWPANLHRQPGGVDHADSAADGARRVANRGWAVVAAGGGTSGPVEAGSHGWSARAERYARLAV